MNDKIKVLYLDDEPINLLLFKSMFERKYNVITVESGIKGLEILKDHVDVQVVISDMKMPLMSGLEFIKKVKPLYPNISFFILSGYDLTEEIQIAINNGLILKYFQKPFRMEEIDKTIIETLHNN